MPGMMDTFLNVGINEKIAEGLIRKTGQEWFAWDNYRRFLQSWGMSFGIPSETFHALMVAHKARHNVARKRSFTADQMRALALKYREAVEAAGVTITDDPKEQLLQSINQVFESWPLPSPALIVKLWGSQATGGQPPLSRRWYLAT